MKQILSRFFWIAVLVFLMFQGSHAQAEEAKITKVEGDGMLIHSDGTSVPAKPGMALSAKDRIATGPNCKVDVAVQSTAGVRLLPDTVCELGETGNDIKVMVKSGNVVLNIRKLPENSSFTLETPLAVAAVRGTQFWGRVLTPGTDPKAAQTFAVREGSVEIQLKDSKGKIVLNEGEAVDIPEDGSIPKPRPALQGELDAMAQASEILTNA